MATVVWFGQNTITNGLFGTDDWNCLTPGNNTTFWTENEPGMKWLNGRNVAPAYFGWAVDVAAPDDMKRPLFAGPKTNDGGPPGTTNACGNCGVWVVLDNEGYIWIANWGTYIGSYALDNHFRSYHALWQYRIAVAPYNHGQFIFDSTNNPPGTYLIADTHVESTTETADTRPGPKLYHGFVLEIHGYDHNIYWPGCDQPTMTTEWRWPFDGNTELQPTIGQGIPNEYVRVGKWEEFIIDRNAMRAGIWVAGRGCPGIEISGCSVPAGLLEFDASAFPWDYYPANTIQNNSSTNWVSCNDSGHSFKVVKSNGGNFEDCKNQQGGPTTDNDHGLIVLNNGTNFVKMKKGM